MNGQPKFQRPERNDVSLVGGVIVMSNSKKYNLTEDRHSSTSRILEQAAVAEICALEGKQQ